MWDGPSHLAREMVRLDAAILRAEADARTDYADDLSAYREFVRDTRSRMLRGEYWLWLDVEWCPRCDRFALGDSYAPGPRTCLHCGWRWRIHLPQVAV